MKRLLIMLALSYPFAAFSMEEKYLLNEKMAQEQRKSARKKLENYRRFEKKLAKYLKNLNELRDRPFGTWDYYKEKLFGSKRSETQRLKVTTPRQTERSEDQNRIEVFKELRKKEQEQEQEAQ